MPKCPRKDCFPVLPSPKAGPHGSYYRSSDGRYIQRYLCRSCRKTFSLGTSDPRFGQKRRDVNEDVGKFLSSSVSLRRTAILLRIHRITVARKLKFLADQARVAQKSWISTLKNLPGFQFDELETFEGSKCKPLSVPMAVLSGSRKILGFEVARMPAKGLLAEKGRRKYGYRQDERGKAMDLLFAQLQPLMNKRCVLKSDSNPHYPGHVMRYFPNARHETVEGRRGCVTGQGELKAGRWDPLFSLNHTFAMLRANVSRLVRKTWCTTKKASSLADHLAIYARYHNTVLT
jgi:transposase-like protein